MTQHTPDQRKLAALHDRARAHKLDPLFTNAIRLAARNTVSAIPDGFPPGGDGGGSGENTPTEGAFLARQRRTRDDVDLAVRAALKAALMIVDGMDALANAYRAVPWGAPADAKPEPCETCKRAGIPELAEHFGTCGGRLERSWRLCEACRMFVYRYGRTPSEIESRQHAANGRWKVTADPKASPFRWADGSTTGVGTPPSAA